MCLSCYFAWKWSDTNSITILAIVCSFVVPSCFQTLSEDLESSEKFTNRPEDLESSGEFSASSGSFLQSLEVFEVRGSYLVGCWPIPFVAAVFAKHWSFRNLGKKFSA